MAPKFEDLSAILPDQITFQNLSGRKLQLSLIGTVVALSVVCITLSCVLGLHGTGHIDIRPSTSGGFEPFTSEACTTTECLETAARLSENMDTSVDPCTDFFQYSCGSWKKRHSIPPDRADYTVVRKVRDENLEKLRELIEKPIVRNSESSSERKLKQFFRMCLHDYGRMRDAGSQMISLINQHLKGWYALDPDNWKNGGWNLNDAISDVQGELNVDVLLRMAVSLDWRTQKTYIRISRGGTSMSYHYYLREDKVGIQDAYKDYMRGVGTLLIRDANITLDGGELERRVEQFVNDAYGQEEQLARLMQSSRSSPGGYRVKKTTISQLEANYTQLPWREMITRAYEGVEISADTKVQVWPIGYFQLVNQLLVNETTDKDRIMNNYLVWQIAAEYSRYLSWEYKYTAYRYYEQAYGRTEYPASWTECMSMTRVKLGSALAAEFLQNHAQFDSKQEVDRMYDTIRGALNNSIENFHWMDNVTKERAEEKVASINRTVGFPNSYFNQSFLDTLHAKLVVNKTDGFFKTILNVHSFQRYMRGLELKSGNDYYMWRFALSGGAGGTLPLYFWRSNYVIVPPGALQFPFYAQKNPSFMNFGGIGSMVAEELVSSINELGRNLWVNGTWTNWWTDNTYSEYLKAKSCFSTFYEGTKVGPFLVNGENKTAVVSGTFQTRRAIDLVAGLRTGLKAYHDWTSQHGGEHMPVGLKLSPDQAYFVSAAQTQCYTRTPAASYMYARYQYIPENIMLNGVLSHMQEFASAFSCGVETKMATNNTCFVF